MLTLETILNEYNRHNTIIIRCDGMNKEFFAWQYENKEIGMYSDILDRYEYNAKVVAFDYNPYNLMISIVTDDVMRVLNSASESNAKRIEIAR